MIIHRSKPFCVWSPLTTFRHAKHHLQGKNKGQHIQCIFNTAMFNQYRMECNQESMKNEERWKAWYQNFHFILFNIKAHFKTTRYTLCLYIGQATFSQYIGRTYKLSTFRNPTQNQLTNSNINIFNIFHEIPLNQNVWAKTIMLVTGFKNWCKKKKQKKTHLCMWFCKHEKTTK